MSTIDRSTAICWPEGIDEHIFLTQYWQKKPLLIRQAFPDFDTPLPADELAGLSLEPDTTPRLITRDDAGAYHLEYGPFNEDRFTTLTDNNWSLLVTDVDKHVPELASYLDPFLFLPSWRIDDLMVSYAPTGASVGAHVDEYDVFLLQASGQRQWTIDARHTNDYELIADANLKLLASFDPTDSWELLPGDMLYLPPGIGHHGIASSDDCTTWSIGFRAPAVDALLVRMAEMISEKMAHQRFTDGPLQSAIPGEITKEAAQRFQTLWRESVDTSEGEFACLLGQFLTESVAPDHAQASTNSDVVLPDNFLTLQRSPFSRFAWHDAASGKQDTEKQNSGKQDTSKQDTVNLFVDSNIFTCSRNFAIDLCTSTSLLEANRALYSKTDISLLEVLLSNGGLINEDQ